MTFRWTRGQARIRLPVVARPGPATLEIRYARFVDAPTDVRVFLSGGLVGTFTARPGRFRTQTLDVELPLGPFDLELLALAPGPGELGLAMDWVRVTGGSFRLPLPLTSTRFLVAGVFLVCLAAGFGVGGATLVGLALAAAQASWAAVDPFGLSHASARVVLPAVAAALACAFILRRYPRGRWVVMAFLASYLLKGAGVFYPGYFYPDVRNHRRYVFALAEATGSWPERGLAAQVQVRTAYPRTIAGKVYAMPYSPLYFVPFTWLPKEPHLVEDALKHVSLACAALEVVVVFFLARALWGEGGGLVASALSAFLPPLESRLLLAMYPTIAGHLLDLLTILLAARLAVRPSSPGRLATFFAGLLASFLTYIAGLFNLTGFALFWALFQKRSGWRTLALWAVAAAATVVVLYASFTRTFIVEILPTLWAGSRGTPEAVQSSGGLLAALGRVPLFYGWGYPALAFAGFVLARRRLDARSFHVLAAYASSILLLVVLRALPGGLFRDLKEITYMGPFVATCAGASVESLAGRNKLASWLVALGLVLFGLAKYSSYLGPVTVLSGLD